MINRKQGWMVALVLLVAGFPVWAKPEIKVTKLAPGDEKGAEAVKTEPKVIPDGPKPVVVCEEPIHDFGELWMGPTLTHSFVLRNTGDAPLEITRVRPSCGCTVAGEYPRTIMPGESGSFPFSLNSTKLRGRFEKSITISTTDPVNSDLRLKVAGVCKRYVDIVPSNAIFGKVIGDEPQERILKITNNTEKPLELKIDPTENGPFKFELIPQPEGKDYELKVTMKPPYKPGDYRNPTTLTTNVEQQSAITVSATATVPERLEIQPPVVTLNPPGPAAEREYTRPIRFTNYGSNPVKLLEATVDDPAVKVSVNERTEGKAYTVNVDIPANYAPTKDATITLKTDDPQKPSVTVPIQASPMARQAKAETQRPQRPAEQMVGQPAPSFSLSTSDGKPLNNDTAKEMVTILDFWAPNCGFCKRQLPVVETVRKNYEGKPVRWVAVTETMRKTFTEDEAKEVLKGTGYLGEVAFDPSNSVGGLFQANSYPTMVVLGKSGKIEAVNVGAAPDLEARLKGQIDAVLAGKPVPAPAPVELVKQAPNLDGKKAEQPKPVEPAKPVAGIGQPAPAFSMATIEGKPFSNQVLKDTVTVLDFWAPNCGFCKKQLPRVEIMRKEYAQKGVRFFAVTQSMRQKFEQSQIMDVLKSTGYVGEVVLDLDNTLGPQFGANGFPTMVVLGKTGKVEATNVGNIPDLETRLKTQLDALLEGKPIPASAVSAPTASRKRPAEDMVGKPAPEFAITTLDGKSVSSAEFSKNKATVLNFVAPNCGFCKKSMPTVDKVRSEYESKGVRFVNLAQTMRQEFTPEQVKETFNGLGVKIELAHDPKNEVGGKYQASGFPTMFIVDSAGKVAAVNIGAKPDLEQLMRGQLDSLIAGKPVTP